MSCYTYTACLVFITFLYKQHNIPVLAHQTQCKSHYITTGTEFLPKCYLHYRESLTLECVIFAQPVLVYIINSHPLYIFCIPNLDLLYPANEPTFQAMSGLMEQFFRIVSVFIFFPDVEQHCSSNHLSLKTILVWTTLLNTHSH